MNVGAYIKAYRKNTKLSQRQLVELISLHQSEVSRLEAGNGSVSRDIIEAMVMAGIIPETPPEPSKEIIKNIGFLEYEDQEILRNMMIRMMK